MNRQPRRGFVGIAAFLCAVTGLLSSCAVYTIDQAHLETKLRPKEKNCCDVGGLNKVLSMQRVQYNNHLDTLICEDAVGKKRAKRLSFDSKIRVITHNNKPIRLYAKTLYIWKDEFLIGERTSPSLKNPNYFPIKLKDIVRIEVRG